MAEIASDPLVDLAVPIAFGDSYGAHPVIGTTAQFVAHLADGPVPAKSALHLEPNGLARALRTGDELEMELHFSTGHLELDVQVEDANAMQHGHAGHQH